jgi:hypothetical protein
MSFHEENSFNNPDDYLYHMAGGDLEQADNASDEDDNSGSSSHPAEYQEESDYESRSPQSPNRYTSPVAGSSDDNIDETFEYSNNQDSSDMEGSFDDESQQASPSRSSDTVGNRQENGNFESSRQSASEASDSGAISELEDTDMDNVAYEHTTQLSPPSASIPQSTNIVEHMKQRELGEKSNGFAPEKSLENFSTDAEDIDMSEAAALPEEHQPSAVLTSYDDDMDLADISRASPPAGVVDENQRVAPATTNESFQDVRDVGTINRDEVTQRKVAEKDMDPSCEANQGPVQKDVASSLGDEKTEDISTIPHADSPVSVVKTLLPINNPSSDEVLKIQRLLDSLAKLKLNIAAFFSRLDALQADIEKL